MPRRKWVRITIAAALAAVILPAAGFGCLYMNGLSGLRANDEARPGQVRTACVGDSITYGHGVQNWPENQYPVVLSKLLGDGYHVSNFGVSGSTAQADGDQPYSGTEVYRRSLDYDGNILIFMLGSNDSKPENWNGSEAFERQYLELLDSYLTGSVPPTVYLCTPASAFYENGESSGPAGFYIQPDVVDGIARIVEEIAAERGYTLVDIHALTGAHPEWFVNDGIHPNQEGAAAIAEEVYRAIIEVK